LCLYHGIISKVLGITLDETNFDQLGQLASSKIGLASTL